MMTLSLAVLLLPFAGFVLMMFFGKRLPRQGDWLETGISTIALGIALYVLFLKLTTMPDGTASLDFPWVNIHNLPGFGPLTIVLGFSVDNLAAIMMAVVMIISTVVHYFSIGYMEGDVRYSRYFGYLGLFTFSMLMIVLANNLLLLYVGWELVGISSYLLIGHW
ncbi:MAG: NADH-quinone oxidoreductase subunit L, partial [Bacteroidetes bacterium]|nr:NADH-quinone oxidoreductase subunit L [Bacteroidota bacterium]